MSLEKVMDLLSRQRLVEGMVHNQRMARHELVESLIQKQHLAELQSILGRQSAGDIAGLLEKVSSEDAQLLWRQIPKEREDEVLWELSDTLRLALLGDREVRFGDRHAIAFELCDGRLRQIHIQGRKDMENAQPLWVDLRRVTPAERNYIGRYYGVELPDPVETNDLEVSARFRVEDNDATHLHSSFLLEREGAPSSIPVAFVLHKGTLFSLRDEELPVFRLVMRRAGTQPGHVADSLDVLLDLYGADVEYSAATLEGIYNRLGEVGRHVLGEVMTDTEAASILATIAVEEDRNGRIRSNILDTQRALSFLMRRKLLSVSQTEDARQIMRDIDSLSSHTSFLFDKINFLMDATVGFINVNQNRRVNQLTILSVVFMPINVLAGIGGMSEFSMMTQKVPWPLAYGSFIGVMAFVGWGTFQMVKYFESRRMAQKTGKSHTKT